MSAIRYSYDAHANVIEIDKHDSKILLPIIKKMVKPLEKRLEHYRDIHESGEATERQQDALCEAEESLNSLVGLIELMEDLTT